MIPFERLSAIFARSMPAVGTTPADVVFKENKWKLLRYRRDGAPKYKVPVLLVPSLINRHYVLDLLPGRSFVEYLVAVGHDVFIIDWGTPGDEDRFLDLDTVFDRYVGRAVRATCRAAGSEQLHLLGYCLGGTITAIHTAARPERIRSLVELAAPIDFHDDGILSVWTRTKTFDVNALVDAFGNVPWPLMQASFHLLKPTLNLVKGVQLVDRAWDDQFLDGFFAVETWSNDNVSFPGNVYRRYLNELYRDNALVEGKLRMSGRPVRLEAITCPTLAITFEHDHIVPLESARILLDRISSRVKEQINLPGGHVGAVVSKKAAATLWPKVSAWWARFESSEDEAPKPKKKKARAPSAKKSKKAAERPARA